MRIPLAVAATVLVAATAFAQPVPDGYPKDYPQLVERANKEGRVVVYSTLDTKAAQPLLKDFAAAYPGIKVEYNDMNSTEIYNRLIAEVAANQGSADVVWSTAMDLQVKLVDDGLAATYESPEAHNLPGWASYKHQAYAATFEPVGFIYNKRLVPAEDVPQDHAAFIRLLATKTDKYRNKVVGFDLEKSGSGFLFATQDSRHLAPEQYDALIRGLAATNERTYASSGNIIEKVASGESSLGYNVLAPYAIARARKDPGLGVVLPRDYTLVYSRVTFVTRSARNPNAARVWTDYVLSKRGQTVLANQADLFAVRSDLSVEQSAGALSKQLGDALKPIPVSADTAAFLDAKKRVEFLNHWRSVGHGVAAK
ncbi:MAG TPA: ABC transporter substrate-binding protein [Casimicrobiaceae bacterium]|jgi:iron(III) transport system substrate-binding protein